MLPLPGHFTEGFLTLKPCLPLHSGGTAWPSVFSIQMWKAGEVPEAMVLGTR